MALLLFGTLKISASIFGIYNMHTRDYLVLSTPNLNFTYSYKNFKTYADLGYTYWKGRYYSKSELLLYQGYLKFQKSGLETKIGKILFLPGFPGLFNPFCTGHLFETISTKWEGEKGIFVRHTSPLASIVFFLNFPKSFEEPRYTFQISKSTGRFETGIYSNFWPEPGLGLFTAYYGNTTIKIQGLKRDTSYKFSAQLECKIREVMPSIWLYYTNNKEMFPLPGFILLTDKIAAIELKFPERVFEVPYILILYDISNKIPIALLDLRLIFGNSIFLESGLVLVKHNKEYNSSVFCGANFSKAF
ncbi:MAG: hypothetical protein ACPLN0_00360 [Candidatus Hydrothermia bacterium]